MGTLLYGRTVRVSIGKRGEPALLIENLRIVFRIEKTLEKTPNNAQIEIYNLSEASRTACEKKDAAIRISAGYGEGAKDIFTGDIAVVTTKRTGADVITSIEAGDGINAFQTKEADLSFAPGAKVGQVLDSLVSSFGLTKGEVVGVNEGAQFLKGVSFSGKVRDHLDTLVGKQGGLDWSIQDNQLQILPKGKGSNYPAVLLTPETGLVGSPFRRVVVNQDIAKKKEGKSVDSGVSAKSLLNPDLVPGRFVSIQAQFLTGAFKIEKVIHSGDTHSPTYYSDIEGVAI